MILYTARCIKEGFGYFHCFDNVTYDSVLLTSMRTQLITITASKATKMRLYKVVSGKYVQAVEVTGKLAKATLQREMSKCFIVNCKMFALVTKHNCRVKIHISGMDFQANSSERSSYNTQLLSIQRPLRDCTIPQSVQIHGMNYYLNVNSIVTATMFIKEACKHPPYSISLAFSNNMRAVINYSIHTRPSEGEHAVITVTCIETSSKNSYKSIKDGKGKVVNATHSGLLLEGSITLPPGCIDVGLCLTTDYGFSCDIGEDPTKALAEFKLLTIYYVGY